MLEKISRDRYETALASVDRAQELISLLAEEPESRARDAAMRALLETRANAILAIRDLGPSEPS
jgi:hypothetical protein